MVKMDRGMGVEDDQDTDEEMNFKNKQLLSYIGGKGILVLLKFEA